MHYRRDWQNLGRELPLIDATITGCEFFIFGNSTSLLKELGQEQMILAFLSETKEK
jgi:hypothetical protein